MRAAQVRDGAAAVVSLRRAASSARNSAFVQRGLRSKRSGPNTLRRAFRLSER